MSDFRFITDPDAAILIEDAKSLFYDIPTRYIFFLSSFGNRIVHVMCATNCTVAFRIIALVSEKTCGGSQTLRLSFACLNQMFQSQHVRLVAAMEAQSQRSAKLIREH